MVGHSASEMVGPVQTYRVVNQLATGMLCLLKMLTEVEGSSGTLLVGERRRIVPRGGWWVIYIPVASLCRCQPGAWT